MEDTGRIFELVVWLVVDLVVLAWLVKLPRSRVLVALSDLGDVRAKERNSALLAEYTLKPGKPVMMIDPPS